MSTKQRTKIQKKVREHHRKARRDAKNNTTWKSKRKEDPGIPNSFPYKEQLLDEIEQTRQREEQRRLELREQRLAEKRRAAAGEDEDESDEEADEELSEELDADSEADLTPAEIVPQLYNGTLGELMEDQSIKNVIITLDARDPLAFRCEQVEKLAHANSKNVILAITKADLAPLEALASHIHLLGSSAGTSSSKSDFSPVIMATSTHSPSSLNKLGQAIKVKGGAVAVLGLEYSGRSDLASHLASQLEGETVYDTTHLISLNTSTNSAGQSEAADEEDDDDDDEEDEEEETDGSPRRRLAGLRALLRNKGQVFKIKDALPLIWGLMPLVTRNEDLMLLYNVPAFGSHQPKIPTAAEAEAAGLSEDNVADITNREMEIKYQKDAEEFLIGLARQQGRARKGGLPDIDAAARVLLRDWCAGCIAYYTYAPGWTGGSISKTDREAVVADLEKQLGRDNDGRVSPAATTMRREWRKAFVEAQKARSDLHPSPAIGELRLNSAGAGALANNAGGDDVRSVTFEFWRPREVAILSDDDDDGEEDEEDDVDDGAKLAALEYNDEDDEELDSDVLVPSDDDADESEDLEDEDEAEAEEQFLASSNAVASRRDKRKAARGSKRQIQAAAGAGAASAKLEASDDDTDEEGKLAQAHKVGMTSRLKRTGNVAGPKKRVRVVEPTKAEKRRR